jgi:hypothetical protein
MASRRPTPNTFVSFSGPPRESIVQLGADLEASLRSAGFEISKLELANEDRLGYWLVRADSCAVEVQFGWVGDPPIEWLITCYGRRPNLKFWKKYTAQGLTDAVSLIDQHLRTQGSVSQIRWYDAHVFALDHGASWYDSPWRGE